MGFWGRLVCYCFPDVASPPCGALCLNPDTSSYRSLVYIVVHERDRSLVPTLLEVFYFIARAELFKPTAWQTMLFVWMSKTEKKVRNSEFIFAMAPRLEIDLTQTPEFDKEQYIGQGKEYISSGAIPIGVLAAQQQMVSLPEFAAALLPLASTPVAQFIDIDLPQVTSGFIMYKAKGWFSKDKPNVDVTPLRHRPVPNEDFLQELDSTFGEAWLDGARSIIDQRCDDVKERLPLWTLTYWKKMVYAIRAQGAWTRSINWLACQQLHSKDQLGSIYANTSQLLGTMGWDSQLTCLRSTVTTSKLQTFLGTAWLSTDHMDIMVEQLNKHIQERYPAVASKVLLVPLVFASALSACNKHTEMETGSLLHFKNVIEKKQIEKLYFLVNIGDHHWIAGCIDFKEKYISFGM